MELDRMPLNSMDISATNREKLKQLFPTVFVETTNEQGELVESVDFEKLKAELGTFTDLFENRRERYGMDWPGKKDAMKIIQQPSVATLKPSREESVNFDDTQNLFIEGDNLEVLKLLQKSYYGKVKMIYIDPPYNTGNEFIYPDNYTESLDTYLSYAGLVDDEGKKFATNTATEGRFHTKWLNMMYPRLYLARNLLREDGVIFISIDEHEIANLQKICDEIYGEENRVAHIIWQHSVQPKGYTQLFSVHHNHIFCYKKSDNYNVNALERTDADNKNYSNPDNDPRGDWRSGDVRNALYRPNLIYSITSPSGKVIQPPENGWRWSKATMQSKIDSGEIVFSADETRIIRKIYLADQKGRAPETIWFASDVGSTREGSNEMKALFNGKTPFDTVKPTKLIKRMLEVAGVMHGDLCVDFFAGSCSTAHAILEYTNANFVMIQLPEFVDINNPSGKDASELGLKTISEVGKERIRRVIRKIHDAQAGKKQKNESALPGMAQESRELDLGFRVLKLDKSNFKVWNGTNPNMSVDHLKQQLELHLDHINPNSSQEDILFEILLKAGYMPTERIDTITLADKAVFSISNGALLVCLEDEITKEVIDEMAKAEPKQVICLDHAFQQNDQLKANAVQTFAMLNQDRETSEQIIFRTV